MSQLRIWHRSSNISINSGHSSCEKALKSCWKYGKCSSLSNSPRQHSSKHACKRSTTKCIASCEATTRALARTTIILPCLAIPDQRRHVRFDSRCGGEWLPRLERYGATAQAWHEPPMRIVFPTHERRREHATCQESNTGPRSDHRDRQRRASARVF